MRVFSISAPIALWRSLRVRKPRCVIGSPPTHRHLSVSIVQGLPPGNLHGSRHCSTDAVDFTRESFTIETAMHKVIKPPVVLTGCRVEQFAIRDRWMKFIGQGRLFSGDREVGPVPRLALARNRKEEVVLLHCDARWQVLGISGGHATLREAKSDAERFYSGISKQWIPTGYTKTQARRALDRLPGPKKCSVCLRSSSEVETLVEFKKRKLAICDVCVRELYRLVSSAKGHGSWLETDCVPRTTHSSD